MADMAKVQMARRTSTCALIQAACRFNLSMRRHSRRSRMHPRRARHSTASATRRAPVLTACAIPARRISTLAFTEHSRFMKVSRLSRRLTRCIPGTTLGSKFPTRLGPPSPQRQTLSAEPRILRATSSSQVISTYNTHPKCLCRQTMAAATRFDPQVRCSQPHLHQCACLLRVPRPATQPEGTICATQFRHTIWNANFLSKEASCQGCGRASRNSGPGL